MFTSLPVAISSWILEAIGFTKLVNKAVRWDSTQCKVTPGDAAKAMVLTMSIGPERPAIENVASRFENEPLPLYFGSVEKTTDLDSDMLARTLTKIHEADENKLFMSVSSAIRTHFGVKSRVVHSDTTSVFVYGEYDCYDENNNGIVLNSAGNRCTDDKALYITRGYSKDHRPDLKQYMLGDAVDDNGIPIASNVLDGNTADSKWNTECLELLKKIIRDEELIYVADSKLVNDPLVNLMVREKVWFISRCPANFNDSLLERTLISFDLNGLTLIKNISPRKDATERRICSTTVDYNGKNLRAVLVETSTLAGKGKKAVEDEEKRFLKSLKKFDKTYNCEPDARKAFEKFRKKHSGGIFDIDAEFVHELVEKRPIGRPRKDGNDIRRSDVWTVNVKYKPNEQKTEALRRRKSHIMILSNVPKPEDNPERGLTDEEIVRYYAEEWRVEWSFKGKKRPVMVERLFMKDVGRAEALITIVNIAALVRAILQLLLRRGVDSLSDDELYDLKGVDSHISGRLTYDRFMESCRSCMIRYDSATNSCRFFNSTTDRKASAFLSIIGIPKAHLFSGEA